MHINKNIILFLIVFSLLYGLVNYYIGIRGYQALSWLNPKMARLWVVLVIVMAMSLPLGRVMAPHVRPNLAGPVIYCSSYWLAAMYYLLLILALADVGRWVLRRSGLLPHFLKGQYSLALLGVLILVLALLIYGTWNARHPVIRNYEVNLSRKSSSLESIQVAAVSDIHLGGIVGIDRLGQMTDIINSLNPDLILFAGDTIDEGVDINTEMEMPAVLQTLHPRLGSFAIMGNHEYISGNAETTSEFLARTGITVLRDQAYEINNELYIVGRDDASRNRFDGSPRQELSAIMATIDKNRLPVILMDHEPSNLQESEQAGVDLQLSGHTHRGQLFPNNYITRAVFEDDWGYWRKNNFQLIVSCGFGTWGPPIRIGNHPEILNIKINFIPEGSQ